MTVVLELDQVSKTFPADGGARVHAVTRVSLSVRAGETVALVGESGCGKSTLSNLAMRMDSPDAGTIRWGGRDVTRVGTRALQPLRAAVQMVFQDPFSSLNPRATVGSAIAEPLKVQGRGSRAERLEKVHELLELVGLEAGMASRYPHEFSGGQRQRICIARAMALDPPLIVADEAVSALDVSVRAHVLDLLMDIQERRKTSYLFVSHDLAVVERIAHRVAVMYLGQIVEIGPRNAVFENPVHSYTRRLLASVPVADPAARTSRRVPAGDLPSPVWPRDTGPEPVQLTDVGDGHLVALESSP